MKLVVAMMEHETNTFSPLPTPYVAFAGATGGSAPPAGDEAVAAYAGTGFAMAAFLDLARREGAEIVVPIAAFAEPSGPVDDAAFDAIAGRICEAIAAGCDAVMLDLHGAMVTASHDDGEGELLRRIRSVAPEVPIAVSLDFHANLSAAMVENASVITAYRTYPHVDMYESGERAGRILLRALKGEARPRMAWASLPMLTHMLRQTPAAQPMKDVMNRAVAAEAEGRVLAASILGGFPLADIADSRLSAVVVTDDDEAAGQSLLREVLGLAWARRADFVFEAEPVAKSIADAKGLNGGPILLVDHGDNSGAGGSMDDMTVIAEALRQGLSDIAAGPICDPQAVAAMYAAGVGARLTLAVGGRVAVPALGLGGNPLELSGVVRSLSDGTFTVEGPMMTGLTVTIGRTAVLDTGAMELVVSEDRCEPFDLGFLSHAGVDPARKRYVIIKSRQHFRAGFEPIARHIVLVAGPGVCSSDYALFPFRKLRRPIYPLDRDAAFPLPWAER